MIVHMDKDRFKTGIIKSCEAIEEMLKFSEEYYELMEKNNLLGNMSDLEMKIFKSNLDKIMRKNFYNLDVYKKELSILLIYLREFILSEDEIHNLDKL